MKNVTTRRFSKVDIASIILSTLGFGGLLYGFSVAGNSGWTSSHVFVSLIIGVITLTIFIHRQLILEEPILEFRIFKHAIFSIATALGMVVFMAMIGTAVILPLFMQNMLDFSAFKSGLALLPGAIIMGVINTVTGRLFDRFGARCLWFIGVTTSVILIFF